jgi:ubiquinone/menaquinone biosynthesis C-methylase UbiE
MEILLYFLPNKAGNIVDVACGRGGTTRYIANYYDPANIMGINISPEQIAVCRDRLPNIRFEEMDAANLEFDDNSIDNILCVEAACHFNTREKFLKEALRVLKPGGCLSLADPLLRRETEIQPRANYLETATEYRQVCLNAGFARAEIYDITEECWNRFTAYQMNKARERLQTGMAPFQSVAVAEIWLRRTAPVAYVVGWAEKSRL